MRCTECKSKFNFVDRIRSMNSKNGMIQCRNCKNIFVIKKNSGRIVNALVSGVLVFIFSLIGSSIGIRYYGNTILVILMSGVAVAFISFIYYFIAQNFWKYERYNKEL